MHDSQQNPQHGLSVATPPDEPHTNNKTLARNPSDTLPAWLKKHWQVVCLVLVFLCMHFYVLSFVNDLIYDEHFWVPEAKRILDREPLDWPTYPALSKLFIASGISILGDNSWGWRIPSVVFGAFSVILVYVIARKVAGKPTALLASFLLVFDNITFTLTGLAMLDVFALPFMLLSFLLYLHNRYALSGVLLALAVVCSPKAVLGVVLILGHWLLVRRKRGAGSVALFALSSFLCFLILMPITDFIATGQWFDPFHRITTMWSSQTSVTVEGLTPGQVAISHPIRPWLWIVDPRGQRLEPLEFHHYLFITPTVWILLWPSVAYLLYRYFVVKKKRGTARFVLLWFTTTYLPWIPLALITDRPLFLYYLLPTMGAICIAVAYGISKVWEKSKVVKDRNERRMVQTFVALYLLVHVGVFLAISPLAATPAR